MASKKSLILTVFLLLVTALSLQAKPLLISFILDASASVAPADYDQTEEMVLEFILKLRSRNALRGDNSDLLLVSFFGGREDWLEAPLVSIADMGTVAAITDFFDRLDHPRYRSTAIYSSLVAGSQRHLLTLEDMGDYRNIIILVTDGTDNSSSESAREVIENFYPNSEIDLTILGVGEGASIAEFASVADTLQPLEDFEGLGNYFRQIAQDLVEEAQSGESDGPGPSLFDDDDDFFSDGF